METTTSIRKRAYAYKERPNYLPELVAFGIIVVTATWPIFSLVNAIATPK